MVTVAEPTLKINQLRKKNVNSYSGVQGVRY